MELVSYNYFAVAHPPKERETAMISKLLNAVRKFFGPAKGLDNESNHHMLSMLDTIPVIMTIWDMDFNMLYCNQEILRLLGLSSKEEYMEDFFKFSPEYQPDGTTSKEKVTALCKDTIKKGKLEYEWTHMDVNGNLIPVECTGTCGKFKGETAFFVYGIDKREIIDANERLQIMFDATPLVIDYWDRDGNCIDCNLFALDFYGLASKDEYKARAYEFTPKKQPDGSLSVETWLDHLDTTFDEGFSSFSFSAQNKDGGPLFYEIMAFRLKLDDGPVVVTYSRDVTEKAHMEIAQANNEAKSRFLARMSHEIRTPISAVLGISEIQLQDAGLSPEVEEAFAKIHSSANILLELVNDILDLSKIEAGKMTLMEEPYQAESLISGIIHIHLVHLNSKKINFEVSIDPQIPAVLIGDALRVKQILNNILNNAFKYTDAGTVSFSLVFRVLGDLQRGRGEGLEKGLEKGLEEELGLEERLEGELVAEIRDTGQGMSEAQLDSLFDEYVHFHKSGKMMGTGLGMAIVYSLVDLMDAYIDVKSKIGVGTSIIVKIPQEIPAGNAHEVIGKDIANKLESFKMGEGVKTWDFERKSMDHGNVLVVDDVDANLYVAKGLLEFYGLNIETCTSGSEAIKKIEDGKSYDIIFLDYMMSDLDGIETMQILRDKGYHKPIVALTANALIGQADEFIKAGFDGFISKPIKTVHLDTILNKFIKDRDYSGDEETDPETYLGINLETDLMETGLMEIDLMEIDLMKDPEFFRKMQLEFAKTQSNVIMEIRDTIHKNDLKTAHRLSHTLKGVALLIKETNLSKIAEEMEQLFEKGEIPEPENMDALQAELDRVLDGIK